MLIHCSFIYSLSSDLFPFVPPPPLPSPPWLLTQMKGYSALVSLLNKDNFFNLQIFINQKGGRSVLQLRTLYFSVSKTLRLIATQALQLFQELTTKLFNCVWDWSRTTGVSSKRNFCMNGELYWHNSIANMLTLLHSLIIIQIN